MNRQNIQLTLLFPKEKLLGSNKSSEKPFLVYLILLRQIYAAYRQTHTHTANRKKQKQTYRYLLRQTDTHKHTDKQTNLQTPKLPYQIHKKVHTAFCMASTTNFLF